MKLPMLMSFQRTGAVAVAGAGLICTGLVLRGPRLSASGHPGAPVQHVGPFSLERSVTPVNQVVTPAGIQVALPGMRPQVLALSPDGRLLVTSGKTSSVVVLDPASGSTLQTVPIPEDTRAAPSSGTVSPRILAPDTGAQVSYTGLVFSPDGSRLYLSSESGSIKVFGIGPDHRLTGLGSLPLPPTGNAHRQQALPAGLAVSADGRRLYVTLTVSNRLAEVDTGTGRLLRLFDVGVAPYDVVITGGKAFVSNWGGRRVNAHTPAALAGLGTYVRVDPVRYIADDGSVSEIDLQKGAVTEIRVGLHPSGLALSPDQKLLFVANASSDTVSVIDTRRSWVTETIGVKLSRADPLEASPNALAVDGSGRTLYVCNGTQNAVAVVSYVPGKSRMRGLIPTGWYPGAIVLDQSRQRIDVANIKGIGSWHAFASGEKAQYNSHQYFGTVSMAPVPDAAALKADTLTVLRNNRYAAISTAFLPPRRGMRPTPVPARSGEPTVFKHVVYIIKENRSYDQVLGDMKEGNGDASLCTFGESITPNEHKISRDFVLLDNTSCCGILSADGHQWTDSAFATDVMERSFCGFPRSYTDGMDLSSADSLVYSPTGFLWDNVLAHHKTLRDYGEFTYGSVLWKDPQQKRAPQFLDIYTDFMRKTSRLLIRSMPTIPTLAPYIKRDTIGWDLRVPDVYRAAQYISELRRYEASGNMPDLELICLPDDHTAGIAPGMPTPAAQVADNDLALGRIVDAISHSRFWRNTCIFVIEDDPQNGWDHVSSFRTTAYVVSAYTRRHAVVSEPYNQTSLVRTIELILGLPAMNGMDASAAPMTACFTDRPNLDPYAAVPNRVPLDQINPAPRIGMSSLHRRNILASARLPLSAPDQCPEDLLNRILWHAQEGDSAPYPAWAVSGTDD